jgi:hypothetical protein
VALGFSDTFENPIVSWVSDEMSQDFGQLKGNILSIEVPSFNLRPNVYNFSFQISYKDTNVNNFNDAMMSAASINVLGSNFFNGSINIRSGNSMLLNANFLIA